MQHDLSSHAALDFHTIAVFLPPLPSSPSTLSSFPLPSLPSLPLHLNLQAPLRGLDALVDELDGRREAEARQ
eukprot:231030-Rhodomonas_salina.1